MVAKLTDGDIFGKAFRVYNRSILPYFEGLRGSTRVAVELRDRGLRKKGVENCQFEFNGEILELAETGHFVSLIDENKFVKKFLEILSEDSVVADLGACKGFYSCVSAIFSDRRVYGFEFAPENLEVFKKNKELNNLDNLEIVEKAVSSSNGSTNAEFEKHGTNSIGQGEQKIETVSLDSYFQDRKDPDIIKIDVEGAEFKVLKGMEGVSESEPDIFLELHHGKRKKGFSHDSEEVVRFLERQGYYLEKISDRRGSQMFFASSDVSKLDKKARMYTA